MKKIYQITLLVFGVVLFSSNTYALHIVTQVELDAFVANNPNLSTYTGDLIIGADIDNTWGTPYSNTDINDLSGLQNLKKVEGDFYILKFKGANLSGLENLEEVTGSFIISGAPILKNLEGLSKMQEVGAEFIISHNYLMEDISGFALDVNIGLSVVVDSNNTMVSLNGYEHLNCPGVIMLCYNPKMTDMSAFQGVTKVKKLFIFNNDEIEELSSLSGLVDAEDLRIYDNPKLFTLDGLSNLETVQTLRIYNNPSLYDCDVEGVCNQISKGDLVAISIYNNKTGCNSISEINCLVANENVKELEQLITISPNPSNGNVLVRANQDLKINKITIVNAMGQIVFNVKNANEALDLNDLQSGMYFVRFSIDNQTVTKRLIVE